MRYLLQVLNTVKRTIDWSNMLMYANKYQIQDAIAIFGTPRSGTTWMMEILGTLPRYKTIFEPLHPTRAPQIVHLKFPPRIYIPPDKDNIVLQKYLRDVFSGKFLSKIPAYSLKNPKILYKRVTATKVITKFVNGNRLIPWINKRFPLRASYLIIRHPCSTINSQLKVGWFGYPKEIEIRVRNGDTNLLKKVVLKEALLIPEIREQKKIIEKISSFNTMLELLAVEYSLDYLIPMKHMASLRNTYVFTYEEIIKNPEAMIFEIFRKIEEYPPEESLKIVRKPSITSKERKINTERQLKKWKYELSIEQVKRILKVVHWFGLDFYTENPEPDYDALKNWKPPF